MFLARLIISPVFVFVVIVFVCVVCVCSILTLRACLHPFSSSLILGELYTYMMHDLRDANIACVAGKYWFCRHHCYAPSAGPKEHTLESLVIDEWRGATSGGSDIVCDAVGNVCPWRVANGSNAMDWNISVAAAVFMVCVCTTRTVGNLGYSSS